MAPYVSIPTPFDLAFKCFAKSSYYILVKIEEKDYIFTFEESSNYILFKIDVMMWHHFKMMLLGLIHTREKHAIF